MQTLLSAALCLLCIATGSHATGTSESILDKRLEPYIQRYVKEEMFRGTVLVASNGKILHRAAYGYANDNAGHLNKLDTRFLIGSLTKSFTAVTVMQLVETGKLDLHAPIAKYLPTLKPELAQNLTLHRLLKHQSGLPIHLERLVALEEKPISSADILAIINTAHLSFTPGEQYEYSNLNYHLAALAIESVTGKSYAQVLQDRTFGPLHMRSSGVERFPNTPTNRANGYSKGLLGIKQDDNNVSYALGSGDIFSTVDDLFIWDQALSDSKLLSEKSKTLLFSGESNDLGNYGYGFRIQDYQRELQTKDHGVLVRHGGSMDGFLSNYHRYTADKLPVIVLANIRPFSIRDFTFGLKEIALGAESVSRTRTEILE